MTPVHTSVKHTAACGALVVGASWLDSGIVPGLVVVDSSRRRFKTPCAAMVSSRRAEIANTLFAPVFIGC